MECPDCGGSFVSREVGPEWPPSTPLADAILETEQDDQVVFHRQCWTRGWSEDRHLKMAAIETEHGDPATVERRQRLDELVDILEEIEDTETLESVLQYVRRQRSGNESESSSTGDNA